MEDVIVIGGGVIGTSILYHLAKKGVKGTLLEKKELASGTSGKAMAISSGAIRSRELIRNL